MMIQPYIHIARRDNSSSFAPLHTKAYQDDFMYVQRVGITYCQENYVIQHRTFDSRLICYVFGGQGTLEYNNTTYSLEKGDLFIIDCSYLHSYYPSKDNPFSLLFLHFNGPLTQKYVEYITQKQLLFHNQSLVKDIVKNIGQIYQLSRKNYSENSLKITEIIFHILMTFLKDTSHSSFKERNIPDGILSVTKYIDDNFTEAIQIDALAQRVSMSEYHFIREFKKYVLQTPYNYVLNCRFNYSKELLLTTSMPIGDIAELLKFSSVSHFTLFFKKRESMTPFQFRKKYMMIRA